MYYKKNSAHGRLYLETSRQRSKHMADRMRVLIISTTMVPNVEPGGLVCIFLSMIVLSLSIRIRNTLINLLPSDLESEHSVNSAH